VSRAGRRTLPAPAGDRCRSGPGAARARRWSPRFGAGSRRAEAWPYL